jgi:hypothetical protein
MIFQILFTLLACALYVAETYREYPWMYGAELVLSVFFGLDYLLYFYCSSDS